MPETIFHGTDVGHQLDTTGKSYLKYLESQNIQESEAYKLTVACIEQGKYYYSWGQDGGYRENKMVENFIVALSTIDNADIMGIYGSAHTGLDALDFSGKVDGMTKQLVKTYGNQVLPFDNYPMQLELGQVFLIEYETRGGAKERLIYISDGKIWEGQPSTEHIRLP